MLLRRSVGKRRKSNERGNTLPLYFTFGALVNPKDLVLCFHIVGRCGERKVWIQCDNTEDGIANDGSRMVLTDIKLDLPLGISEEEAKLFLAIKLYELGKVSLGKAAEISGFSKVAFLEILGRYQVPVFAYSPEELRQEVEE